MRRICFVVASRANYGRVQSVIDACDERKDLDVRVIATASAVLPRYGEATWHLQSDGISFVELPCVVEGATHLAMVLTTGLAVTMIGPLLEQWRPDIVVTVADRHETLATAIAARYQNICLAHIQGGEMSGSIDDRVRDAVTMLADWHFPATKEAEKRIKAMRGFDVQIDCVGCPGLDLVERYRPLPSKLLDALNGESRYALVVYHPDTDTSDHSDVLHLYRAVQDLGIKIVWLWPNCDAGSDKITAFLRSRSDPGLLLFRGFSPRDYLAVLEGAEIAVGNSSSFIREGSFLGTPAVIVGTRQRNRDLGDNAIACKSINQLRNTLSTQVELVRNGWQPKRSHLYGNGHAGEAIAEALATWDLPPRARP